jgi:hypothetical protein
MDVDQKVGESFAYFWERRVEVHRCRYNFKLERDFNSLRYVGYPSNRKRNIGIGRPKTERRGEGEKVK